MFYSMLISIHAILCLFILLICLKAIAWALHSLMSRCRLLIVSLKVAISAERLFEWVRLVGLGSNFGGGAASGLKRVFGVGLRLQLRA